MLTIVPKQLVSDMYYITIEYICLITYVSFPYIIRVTCSIQMYMYTHTHIYSIVM